MHQGETREEESEDEFEDANEENDDGTLAVLHHDEHVDYRVGQDLLVSEKYWCDLGEVENLGGTHVQVDHKILVMVWIPVTA